jgi:hypothetical protein
MTDINVGDDFVEIGHVCDFDLSDDKTTVTVQENCDYYYSSSFNKKGFKEILDSLTMLYEKMV